MSHRLAGGLKSHSTVLYPFIKRDACTWTCRYKKRDTYFACGIPICLQRDDGNLFLSLLLGLPFPLQEGPAEEQSASPRALCHRRKHWELQEGLSVLSVRRRISRQSPFSPALKCDTYESALWLIEQLLFAWYVKQWRDGPYSVKATSSDNFVAFECLWTSDVSFPSAYLLNVIGQPREPKKPSCYIGSDCSNSFICRSTKAFKKNIYKKGLRDFFFWLFFFFFLLITFRNCVLAHLSWE